MKEDKMSHVPGGKIRMSLDAFIAEYGCHVDRIGKPRGTWLAVAPDGVPVSFESRSLPHSALKEPHYSYKLSSLPEGYSIEVSTAPPWFGYSGGATQLQILDADGELLTVLEALIKGALS